MVGCWHLKQTNQQKREGKKAKYECTVASQSCIIPRILKFIAYMVHYVSTEFHSFLDLNCYTDHYVFAWISTKVYESYSIWKPMHFNNANSISVYVQRK